MSLDYLVVLLSYVTVILVPLGIGVLVLFQPYANKTARRVVFALSIVPILIAVFWWFFADTWVLPYYGLLVAAFIGSAVLSSVVAVFVVEGGALRVALVVAGVLLVTLLFAPLYGHESIGGEYHPHRLWENLHWH